MVRVGSVATAIFLCPFLQILEVLAQASKQVEFQPPGFPNRYYQAVGYKGTRVLEHNETGRFNSYVEAIWPNSITVDRTGRIWLIDKRFHQVLLMKSSSRYIAWPAFSTEYAGSRGTPGYYDGSRLKAKFNSPSALALTLSDKADFMIYVADTNNHCIRALIYAQGRTFTLAGRPDKPGMMDGPGDTARFRQPASLGMDPDGKHLFVMDNGRRLRYIDLSKAMVSTLVSGACRAVMRWTVYESITLRRVGCHPDWSAIDAGEEVDTYAVSGLFYCRGHMATCSPRGHPALADRLSPQLRTKEQYIAEEEARRGQKLIFKDGTVR
eukprot:TRINITY_DN19786_c0_g1_i1.p1 TRINITY_DN19786_c0_g1~~TRINITY_DN19786_c0_g1_i1.p1  ORF type:complete len:324 (+),score=29.13 TRINITY_DN19786_c0_g1_i1:93-1064(+)